MSLFKYTRSSNIKFVGKNDVVPPDSVDVAIAVGGKYFSPLGHF